MVLDIVLVLAFLACLAYGYYRGFMGAVVGFGAKLITLILALALASPIATLINNWFNLSRSFDGILGGAGGHFITIFICGAAVYILFRLFFLTISRFIRNAKRENRAVDRLDKIAGVLLGVAKFFSAIILLSTITFLLSVIPLVGNSVDLLFSGSTVGLFLYNLVVEHALPNFGVAAWARAFS